MVSAPGSAETSRKRWLLPPLHGPPQLVIRFRARDEFFQCSLFVPRSMCDLERLNTERLSLLVVVSSIYRQTARRHHRRGH